MSPSSYRPLVGLLLAGACLLPQVAHGQGNPAKKYALIVGVNSYDHSKFRNLEFAENDARELANLLTKNNYDVTLITGAKADLENIQTELKAKIWRRNRHELVVVALAGHGLFFPDKNGSYFCPKDAQPSDPKSMLALTELYKELAECGAGAKLLLVDACREEAVRGTARTRGVDTTLPPPEGVGVLFSCSPGQFAFESAEYKHGVFFYHVLEAMRGKARDEGEITWDSLRSYVKRHVARDVERMFPAHKQVPNEVSNLSDIPALLKSSTPYIAIPVVPPPKRIETVIVPVARSARPFNGSWTGVYHYPPTANRQSINFHIDMNYDGRIFTAATKEINRFWEVDPKISRSEPYLYANCQGRFDQSTNRLIFTKQYDGTAGAGNSVSYTGNVLQNATVVEGEWVVRTPGRPDFRGKFSMRKD